MKLVIVITDGVGVRNFIHGRFLYILNDAGFELHIVSSVDIKESLPEFIKGYSALYIYRESKLASFFRKTAEVVHFLRHRTYAMNYNFKRIKFNSFNFFTLRTFLSVQLAKILVYLRLFDYPGKISEKIVSKNPLFYKYYALFKNLKPDLIFVSHQRPPLMSPLVVAAKKNNIPASAFIFSWDNLSSKGRFPVLFDHYLVWSELMKTELLHFYPNTALDNIHISGTPQFETYFYHDFGYSKEEFYNVMGFDVSFKGKLILYSCGDVSTSPNDEHYITILANWILSKELCESYKLIVRTSPAEGSERFDDLKHKFKFIYWNVPDWRIMNPNHPEPWSQRTPTMNDIHLLKSLLIYSDINVNMCSTMSLDFSLFDKPVINPVFGFDGNSLGLFSDQEYLCFDHYANVVNSGAVYVSKTEHQFLRHLEEAISFPTLNAEGRKKLIEMQILQPMDMVSERFAAIFKKIILQK